MIVRLKKSFDIKDILTENGHWNLTDDIYLNTDKIIFITGKFVVCEKFTLCLSNSGVKKIFKSLILKEGAEAWMKDIYPVESGKITVSG